MKGPWILAAILLTLVVVVLGLWVFSDPHPMLLTHPGVS